MLPVAQGYAVILDTCNVLKIKQSENRNLQFASLAIPGMALTSVFLKGYRVERVER